MSHIYRHLSAVSDVRTAQPAKEVRNAQNAGCTHCNYSNNYYGDQICVPSRAK